MRFILCLWFYVYVAKAYTLANTVNNYSCNWQLQLVMPFTFYVPIDFIFYLIVFFLVLTTVPCVRFI